jgi:hypothetical protein
MICKGVALFRSVLAGPLLKLWTARVDFEYQKLKAAHSGDGLTAASPVVAPGQRYVPTASSFTVGAVFSEEDLRGMLSGIDGSPVGAWITEELQGCGACNLDQAWIRRQYAPQHYPPLHAPHRWHQDGALGFDFLAYPDGKFPSDALLPMVTCWIALGSCGVDAPGLEIVRRRIQGLLAPAELADESVRGRFAPAEFWRPELEGGDAIVFRGDILHRTHVMPSMQKDRTSIELRFFAAENLPKRLQGDRFLLLAG